MHELPVTESILKIVLEQAHQAGAVRVSDVYLVIGDLSSIVDDSVQFYWEILSQGTIAEAARLHFRRIPFELTCQDCGHRFTPGGSDYLCPACGGFHVQITGGNEFYVESITVLEPEDLEDIVDAG